MTPEVTLRRSDAAGPVRRGQRACEGGALMTAGLLFIRRDVLQWWFGLIRGDQGDTDRAEIC